MTTATSEFEYCNQVSGVHVPPHPVLHREDEYDSEGFAVLHEMQSRHFWYRGRHRFLSRALHRAIRECQLTNKDLRGIDLGGGCGEWVRLLSTKFGDSFSEIALGDSSLDALKLAEDVVGPNVERYQTDILNLSWKNRWDVVFLLDVLEHIPEDTEAMRQIYRALRPGGLLFVTTPALQNLWSYMDDMVHHVRRYSRKEFAQLASSTGFELHRSHYFNFLLSPLLYASRLRPPNVEQMTTAEINEHIAKKSRVPAAPINAALRLIFSMETPIGHHVPFPFGTSILGVFRKPLQMATHE